MLAARGSMRALQQVMLPSCRVECADWSKVADDTPESSLAGYAHYDLGWIAAETGIPSDATPRWLEALRWIEAHPNAPLAAELARAIEQDFCASLSPQPNAADLPPP